MCTHAHTHTQTHAHTHIHTRAACAAFAREVTPRVLRAWRELCGLATAAAAPPESAQTAAAEANSKFSMTEGAFVGSFGTLKDFYAGPEALIGYPNPKLYEAMVAEHCTRPNTRNLFTAPNYGLVTTPEWEWQWVVDPDTPPASLRAASHGLSPRYYPGEVDDQQIEIHVRFIVRAEVSGRAGPTGGGGGGSSGGGGDHVAEELRKLLEAGLPGRLAAGLLETPAEVLHGARVLPPAQQTQRRGGVPVSAPPPLAADAPGVVVGGVAGRVQVELRVSLPISGDRFAAPVHRDTFRSAVLQVPFRSFRPPSCPIHHSDYLLSHALVGLCWMP